MAAKHIALCMTVLLVGSGVSAIKTEAAKVVPTIRIEIPSERQGRGAETPKIAPDDIIIDEEPFIDLPEDEPPQENIQTDEPPLVETEEPRAPVKVFYGDEDLPEAVRATRRALLDIAKSGDVEKLKPLFEKFSEPPIVDLEGSEDTIAYLKESSGDGEGVEVLAILIEVLESGYVHREKNEDGEIFVWPYFVEMPLEDLNKKQLVELFHIITAGDFADMKDYGAYIFYRVGITPDGELKYFFAGD